MARQQQERGWPLGLRPLVTTRAARAERFVLLLGRRNLELSGSGCTFMSDSQTSRTNSSSDLDTESTGTFFPDRSITLGRLMGIAGFVELPSRSNRGSTTHEEPPPPPGGGDDDDYSSSNSNSNKKKTQRAGACWILSLCFSSSCSAAHADDGGGTGKKTTPCLADFLALERRDRISDAVPLT